LRKRAILPTGNCRPAFCERDTDFDPLVFPLPPPPAAVPAAELIALRPSLRLSDPDLDKSYDTQTHTREGKRKQKSLAKQIANNTREREREREHENENRERFAAKIGTQQHKKAEEDPKLPKRRSRTREQQHS